MNKSTPRKFLAAALLSRQKDIGFYNRAELIAACPDPGMVDDKKSALVLEQMFSALPAATAAQTGPALNRPMTRLTARQIDMAHRQAQVWLEQKVFVLPRDQLGLCGKTQKMVPPVFFAWGVRTELDLPRAAVLNSRKPRRISPEDRWLKVTKAMIGQAADKGLVMLTSLGNYQYEIAAFFALEAGTRQVIICDGPLPLMLPEKKREQFFCDYGDLFSPERTTLISPFSPGPLPPVRQRRPYRDACLTALAGEILAAEIRSQGNMEHLIKEALRRGAEVKVFCPSRFDRAAQGNKKLLELGARPWKELSKPGPGFKTMIRQKKKTIALQARDFLSDLEDGANLIHFTRSCPGPWPGQTPAEYYRALTSGRSGAAHTAFDTLRRILDQGRIRGGSGLTRGRAPVVSFTAGGLDELSSLVRWRPGLIRWTFEPYGLAVTRAALQGLGAAPVVYGGDDIWEKMPDGQKFRFQLHQPPKTDWSGEKEWRLEGDVDLGKISKKDIKIIVPSREEARKIASEYGLRVVLAKGLNQKYEGWRKRQAGRAE
ncbi:MAG: hypothetical protein SV487_03825 [Thermodesulfobacteriota bacterium]|nr:hypothetical protein [Thermodesulfobacteriota bacterium]